ncbi:NAD-dependent epimerase/dehydratase family protein [Microvirga flavescens]|uniref:NAD-dependent epimerase/dehydratase family protein n=1 Tax=Microvirga flavescens TaxID=2249811 RepID=UPI000DD68CBF|nr:NAD-dependent epimerase/dehydratase family protein [Microvirga flavescens]
MERYLVTGGCGFIGSHLVDALIAGGADVVVLDNMSTGRFENLSIAADLVVGDVRNRTLVRKVATGCDGIFHLAAIASVPKCTKQWHAAHTVNLSSSIGVFEVASDRDLPVVYASSSAVYGDAPHTPIDEEDQKRPISPYGADKLAMELHAYAGARVRGLNSFGLRFFNIYGPRQDASSPYSGVVSIFMQKALQEQPLLINGDGRQTRDFVFVGDAVAACCAAMRRIQNRSDAAAEVSNVCTGQGTSIRTLAEYISQLLHRPLELTNGPARAGDILTSVGSTSRLSTLLNFKPKTPLLVGLEALLPPTRILPPEIRPGIIAEMARWSVPYRSA